MMNAPPKIPLGRALFNQDELKEVASTLQTGWPSRGPKCAEFEKAAAEYLGVKHAVAVANCTAALHLALHGLDIGRCDEVIVPDFTFPATALAVLYAGARPVFVDVDIRTFCIDPAEIRKAITEKTKAIMPVHLFGQVANMEAIEEICRDHDLLLIEDAAGAFGAERNGRKAGTFGDAACFSFHGRKILTTGEGGLLVTDDDELAHQARQLSQFGIDGPLERNAADPGQLTRPTFTRMGWNYKMSDITAAVGLAQLNKIAQIQLQRQILATAWNQFAAQVPGVEAPFIDEGNLHAWQAYVVRIDDDTILENTIRELQMAGVQTTFGTYSCTEQPYFAPLARAECVVSRHLYWHTLALPMPMGLEVLFRPREDEKKGGTDGSI
jgi:dTDP-4-amino-4,6-dideoxygalactose transaminase